MAAGPAVLDIADTAVLRGLDVRRPALRTTGHGRRPDVDRQEPSENLCREGHQGHFRRRRRRRRSQGRAEGDRRLSARSEGLRAARRAYPQGHPAGRPARYGQDAAGARGRRRGGRQVLLDFRLRVRRDVRRRRRRPGARPVRAGAERRRRRSSSSTNWTPWAAPAALIPLAATTRRSRR